MLAFRPISSLGQSLLLFREKSLDSCALGLSTWLDRWIHEEERAMNQAIQLDDAPRGTAATDPNDDTVVPDESIPKEGDAVLVVDDELPEEQLMWLGRS
jgi:hypothetical protein